MMIDDDDDTSFHSQSLDLLPPWHLSSEYHRIQTTLHYHLNMDRYDVREELGDGTFGTVFRAYNIDSREEVRLCPANASKQKRRDGSIVCSALVPSLDETMIGGV